MNSCAQPLEAFRRELMLVGDYRAPAVALMEDEIDGGRCRGCGAPCGAADAGARQASRAFWFGPGTVVCFACVGQAAALAAVSAVNDQIGAAGPALSPRRLPMTTTTGADRLAEIDEQLATTFAHVLSAEERTRRNQLLDEREVLSKTTQPTQKQRSHQ
jgi:hypothetical protein